MDNKKESMKSLKEGVLKRKFLLGLAVIIIVVCCGSKMIYESWKHETTDDAQVDGNIIPLRTTVSGYIRKIQFTDNQQVKKGDTLIIFDTVSLLAEVNRAQAQIQAAQAELQSNQKQISASEYSEITANFNSGSAKDNIEIAKAHEWQAKKEYQRIEKMYNAGAATQQALDNAKMAYQVNNAQLKAANKQFRALTAQRSITRSQTNIHYIEVKQAEAHIKQAKAQLALAKDQYDHAFIIASCDGVISKKNIEVGQFIPAGMALASLISLSDIWITANFKETQLNDMKKGQDVDITVDAYPDLKIKGKVESFCGATGSKFSILPAENATGNFIKVTQRIPVRILLAETNSKKKLLLPGMNAVISVKTR